MEDEQPIIEVTEDKERKDAIGPGKLAAVVSKRLHEYAKTRWEKELPVVKEKLSSTVDYPVYLPADKNPYYNDIMLTWLREQGFDCRVLAKVAPAKYERSMDNYSGEVVVRVDIFPSRQWTHCDSCVRQDEYEALGKAEGYIKACLEFGDDTVEVDVTWPPHMDWSFDHFIEENGFTMVKFIKHKKNSWSSKYRCRVSKKGSNPQLQ
jgi:hypothetical protein